eukprot:730830-Pelagomonas_calceolata.AAC.1
MPSKFAVFRGGADGKPPQPKSLHEAAEYGNEPYITRTVERTLELDINSRVRGRAAQHCLSTFEEADAIKSLEASEARYGLSWAHQCFTYGAYSYSGRTGTGTCPTRSTARSHTCSLACSHSHTVTVAQ